MKVTSAQRFKIHFKLKTCVCVCKGRGREYECERKHPQRPKPLDPLELEFQVIASFTTWVRGREPGSPERTAATLNHRAISPAPALLYVSETWASAVSQWAP